MAKVNLNDQDNLHMVGVVIVPVCFLICLIFSVLGIKLWWFKHRLSFEHSSKETPAAADATPNAVVIKREKKPRFSKDKRWSQQVYHNVQVHGVFKQTKEDDSLIQTSLQLPPVRIRQAESAPSLLLPPPRYKRRPQYVQSTAFEELSESHVETFNETSYTNEKPSQSQETHDEKDSALIGLNSTTEVSLTFKEVEKVFPNHEIKIQEDVLPLDLGIPSAPKRIGRSSSTLAKVQNDTEKSHHRYLKSSQSISIPEHRKIVERKPTEIHKPSEDLTKIDDLEESQFDKFTERRVTKGYIKYEEIDNQATLKDYRQHDIGNFYNAFHNQYWSDMEPIEALRNEEIIYQNPTSPDICEINEAIEKYENSLRPRDFAKDNTKFGITGNDDREFNFNDSEQWNKYKNHKQWESNSSLSGAKIDHGTHTQFLNSHHSYKSPEIQNCGEDIKKPQLMENNDLADWARIDATLAYNKTVKEASSNTTMITDIDDDFTPQPMAHRIDANLAYNKIDKDTSSNPTMIIDIDDDFTPQPMAFVEDLYQSQQKENEEPSDGKIRFERALIDNSEEKFTLNQRRPTTYVIRSSLDNEEEEETQDQKNSETMVRFENSLNGYKNEEKFTLNQRRPTAYVIRSSLDTEEEEEEEERHDQKNSETVVRFEKSLHQNDKEEKFTLNQRRPTAYVINSPFENEEVDELNASETSESMVRFEKSLHHQHDKDENITLTQKYMIRSPLDTAEEDEAHHQESSETMVRFDTALDEDDRNEKFTLNQRRPTDYVIRSSLDNEEDEEQYQQSSETRVRFETPLGVADRDEKSTLNQRRPTAYVIRSNFDSEEDEVHSQESSETRVRFEIPQGVENKDEKFTLNQRRPTAYVIRSSLTDGEENEDHQKSPQAMVRFENSLADNDTEEKFTLNQRRPTAYALIRSALDYEDEKEERKNFEVLDKFEDSFVNENHDYERSTTKATENLENPPHHVKFLDNDEDVNSQEKFTLNQRRPTAFVSSEQWVFGPETKDQTQTEDFLRDSQEGNFTKENGSYNKNELNGISHAKDIRSSQNPKPKNHANLTTDIIWQELEKDIDMNHCQNIEEEFSRIRHSIEMNEADFLELKEDLQLASPPSSPIFKVPYAPTATSDNGFGKTIEDDWENFEKLQTVEQFRPNTPVSHDDISLTYNMISNAKGITTVSILKESKMDYTPEITESKGASVTNKPNRKSKVTFDFKAEEYLIPSRKYPSDEEEYEDVFDNKTITAPIPMQRLSNLNYIKDNSYSPVVASSTKISLFGSSSHDQDDVEDSWSAIRKHRNMTTQFQNLDLSEPPSHPPPPLPIDLDDDKDDNLKSPPPPKPAYRNPMAQLAIQRAKEVRNEMEGFKGRSIRDVKKRTTTSQEILNLKEDFDDTEA
ncbi:uncharacterized protein LOC142233634 [Haematobia irritans]|uniref:uncharacterized protein LOC142233634 n=1 Tax=Haematobia irritans TaxID=7368 RepID=UPI003F507A45